MFHGQKSRTEKSENGFHFEQIELEDGNWLEFDGTAQFDILHDNGPATGYEKWVDLTELSIDSFELMDSEGETILTHESEDKEAVEKVSGICHSHAWDKISDDAGDYEYRMPG